VENALAIAEAYLGWIFSAATRKLNLAPDFAQRRIEIFSLANIVQFEAKDLVSAIELHRLVRISFWDALQAAHQVQPCCTVKIYGMELCWAECES
jgi:predicted nucleic acid-binding protein